MLFFRSRLWRHEHRAGIRVLVRAHSPDRQAGSDRAHAPRRHGHRPVRLARRPQGPRGHRLPGGGERLHGGADLGARRPACRPCSTRSRRAPRRPTCRCRCARETGGGTRAPWRGSSTPSTAAAWSATARSRRRCPRTASHWTARRCCSTGTNSPRARRSSRSARSRCRRTGSCSPTPPTSPATSGTRCGSRTWSPASTLAGRGAGHPLRRRVVARRIGPVLRHGGRHVAAVPGVAAHRRDADLGRRGGVRGERREVLARGRDVPRREVADDPHLVQADQRGVAA